MTFPGGVYSNSMEGCVDLTMTGGIRSKSFADVMYSSSLSEALRVLPDGLVDGGAIVEAGVPQRVHDGHGAPEPHNIRAISGGCNSVVQMIQDANNVFIVYSLELTAPCPRGTWP